MKAHLEIPRKRKFLRQAQADGIFVARETFHELLKRQPFLFSWDNEPEKFKTFLSNFQATFARKAVYKHSPDKAAIMPVVIESLYTEYSNLKENRMGNLPIIQRLDQENIQLLVFQSTVCLFRQLVDSEEFGDIRNKRPLSEIKVLSFAELDKCFTLFSFSPAVQEAAFYELNLRWSELPSNS